MRDGGTPHPVPEPRALNAPDAWLVVSVLAPPGGEALMLIDALRRIGARAVEREGTRLVASFPPGTDPEATARSAEAAARSATSLSTVDPVWRWQSREEWTRRWLSEQATHRITERIAVVPGGADDATAATGSPPDPAPITIRLDPTAAFGTAEHPTTRAALRLLEGRVRTGDRILDVGTGSGVLAIAAALLGARQVLALEADPLACEAARSNARNNGVSRIVRVRERQVRPGRRPGRFHGALANLQAAVSLPLLPSLAASLERSGWIVLAGITGGERDGAVRAAESAGLGVVEEIADDGWWAAALVRNDPARARRRDRSA